MTENEFILADRLQKIQSTIEKYGIDNFCISFSGGKDSCVMSSLVDMAIPGNNIPRVYADTGIEYNMIRNFVYSIKDERFHIIRPSTPIKKMLEEKGYPFKSKMHSAILFTYQRSGRTKGVVQYLGERDDKDPWCSEKSCPAKLKYQFKPEFGIKVSDKCCLELKEKPLLKWQRENGKKIAMVGIMREEGGRRFNATCMRFKGEDLVKFHPLAPITKAWEEWFIAEYNVTICDIYKPPYNFVRTGCKGCPFAAGLQKELDTLEKYFPQEKAQCEIIWRPIYEEYRRIGYRLRKEGD